jgi:hypothetical protein
VLLPLEAPPSLGVFRAWHELSTKHAVHVLPVSSAALKRATASTNAGEHLRGLVHRVHQNPFEIEGPLRNELDFYGSREEMSLRVREIAYEHSGFGLFGLEKWGTTSMLLRMRGELNDRLAAWVDLAGLPDLNAPTVLGAMAEALTRDLTVKVPTALPTGGGRPPGAAGSVNELLGLVGICHRFGLTVPPVIFVDRVDELTRLGRGDPSALIELVRALYALSSPARGSERFVLIVAGSDDDFLSRQDFEIERNRVRNPFWRSMKTYYTPFLTADENSEFLERLGALAGVSFEREALDESYRQTGGHKYLTRLLGAELCRERDLGPIDAVRVRDATAVVVTRHSDYLRAILEHAPRETGALLRQVAAGPAAPSELLKLKGDLPGRAGGPLAALQFALNYGLIRQRRGQYALSMGLLATWLDFSEGGVGDRQPAAN